MNIKLALLSFIQKRQSVTLDEVYQFAVDKLQIKNKKYLYSAYLYSLLKQGHIVRQRRGLYSIVDVEHPSIPPDPYIIASKIRHPYYLGYASALDLHGAASALFTWIVVAVATGGRFSPFNFPKANPRYTIHSTDTNDYVHGLRRVPYQGQDLIVSSPARTFIDVVDRPNLAGGWEEVVRSLDLLVANFLRGDLDEVSFLLDLFGSKSLAARVGFFLEVFASVGSLILSLDSLNSTRAWVTSGSPTYLFSRSSLDHVVRDENWNIYVPVDFVDRYFAGQRLER